MGIYVDQMMSFTEPCNAVFSHLKVDTKLRDRCRQLCKEFPDLWKPELGCFKHYELEVEFKRDSCPIFCKARPVPLALREHLQRAHEEGIQRRMC